MMLSGIDRHGHVSPPAILGDEGEVVPQGEPPKP